MKSRNKKKVTLAVSIIALAITLINLAVTMYLYYTYLN